jgi:flap endonuclease-1
VFVFDGKPPELKKVEITKRRGVRDKAFDEWKKALEAGDYATAFSKAVVTSRLTQPMVNDAMGIPYVQAPSEAEAQAAYMASNGSVWAASSKDYDSLLFGTPRLVRYLTITGKKYLPSKKTFRPLKPELILLEGLLKHHKITREQLIDIAILIGTDFNQGAKGIGPKKALKFTKTYGQLENFPSEILLKLSTDYNRIREIFTEPEVTQNYRLEYGLLQEEELYHFLCEERDFSRKRVETAVQRMREFYSKKTQAELGEWLK